MALHRDADMVWAIGGACRVLPVAMARIRSHKPRFGVQRFADLAVAGLGGPSSGFNGSSFKLMSAPRPGRWIGEGNGSPLPTHQSFEIAAFKGITAQDAMATEKP